VKSIAKYPLNITIGNVDNKHIFRYHKNQIVYSSSSHGKYCLDGKQTFLRCLSLKEESWDLWRIMAG